MPTETEQEALEEAFFQAADTARTEEDHERAHQLGVKAFPGIAMAHDDGTCMCRAHVQLRGGV